MHELRALAAARDKVGGRLPPRLLGLSGGQVAIIVLVLAVAVVAASLLVWRSRPVASAVSTVGSTASTGMTAAATTRGAGADHTAQPGGTAAPGAEAAAGEEATTEPATITVHVAGKVAQPGVVAVPGGSRVGDAIDAAGGALSGVDLRTVNLARPVADGEQVLVGFPPEEGAPPAPDANRTGEDGGATAEPPVVDLNTATTEELEELPGVGPVLAQRLLDYRDERGGFTSVDELLDVSGIGEVTFGELEPMVTVG